MTVITRRILERFIHNAKYSTKNLSQIKSIKKLQRSLPKAPVPSLDYSLDRYLQYAAVVAAGQGRSLYDTHLAVESFRKEGLELQKKLENLAESNPNWINLFWLPEMYLRIRLPLPVFASPAYIFPQRKFENDGDYTKYAALLVQGFIEYKDRIDRKDIEREVSTGKNKVKMCMEQYDRILSCYRMPGEVEDKQIERKKTNNSNEHILVMCNNQSHIVFTRMGGRLVSLADLIFQLKQVKERSEVRNGLAIPIGAASTGERTIAAEFWNEMNKVEGNAKSLDWVKSALFAVCLDTDDQKNPGLPERGKYLLTGGGSRKNGFNRWYDCTIQLIVSSSGISGLCIEHSVAEGIVIINMAEASIKNVEDKWNRKMICSELRHVSSKPLSWTVSNHARDLLEQQRNTFDELAFDLDLDVLNYDSYGKEFIKSCGVSPDGYIQLAMQLAHFKCHGYLCSTYESASIRRFTKGRVDNIRANTQQALEWVTSMKQNGITKDRQRELFRKATEKQAMVTAENISGYGIDNHLCALSVLARECGKPMPKLFEDPMWDELMRFPLSTSQVTTSPLISDTYLCYGAVVRDGYGCAYNIQKDNIIFAPSAYKSDSRTNLTKFKDCLGLAMDDIRKLMS